MSFPPPPLPSPTLVPFPLPTPPSSTRFHSPPSTTHLTPSHSELDEFGAVEQQSIRARKRSHRQSLSLAVPYRSPPPSPTLSAPPPPVPPIPPFALSPSDKKPVLCTSRAWDGSTDADTQLRKQRRQSKAASRVKNHPMTCAEFLIRNTTQETARTAAV